MAMPGYHCFITIGTNIQLSLQLSSLCLCLNKLKDSKLNESRSALATCLVGMAGFEPAASPSRTKRTTGLRYIPQFLSKNIV